MRGDDQGAAEKTPKSRRVLMLSGNVEESETIRALARARGLDVVELEVEREADGVEPLEDWELVWHAGRVRGRKRVESGLRPSPWLSRGPLSLEPETGEINVSGSRLELRRTERDVLVYLMQNAHRFVTPRELQEQVLKAHGDGGAARNQVYELRRKLRNVGHAEAIETRTHLGYRLRWSS